VGGHLRARLRPEVLDDHLLDVAVLVVQVADCLERLDAEPRPFTGSVRILRSLSDTQHVSTQGPVWYLDGHAV